MQDSFVSLHYVCSRITLHYSCKVDQRWSRAIHNCDECFVDNCCAIHYGQCQAITVPSVGVKSLRQRSSAETQTPSPSVENRLPIGVDFNSSEAVQEQQYAKPDTSVSNVDGFYYSLGDGRRANNSFSANTTMNIQNVQGVGKVLNEKIPNRAKPYTKDYELSITHLKDSKPIHPPINQRHDRSPFLNLENRHMKHARPKSLNLDHFKKHEIHLKPVRPLSLNFEKRHNRAVHELVYGERGAKSPTHMHNAVWPRLEGDISLNTVVDEVWPKSFANRVHHHDKSGSHDEKHKLGNQSNKFTSITVHSKKFNVDDAHQNETAEVIYNNLESYLNRKDGKHKHDESKKSTENKYSELSSMQSVSYINAHENHYSEIEDPEPVYATITPKENGMQNKTGSHSSNKDNKGKVNTSRENNLKKWNGQVNLKLEVPQKLQENINAVSNIVGSDFEPEEIYDNAPPNIIVQAKNMKNKDLKISKDKITKSAQTRNKLQQNVDIPKFYFPMGRPISANENDAVIKRVTNVFSNSDGGKIFRHQMDTITKACNLPTYWKCPLFLACGGDKYGYITLNSFTQKWKEVVQCCHDEAARFVKLLAKQGFNYLVPDDFMLLMQDVVDSHPGLTFLQDAPEFHSRYMHTVISRIFYTVNRSWTGRITIAELRRSNFLQTLSLLEDEEDINQVTDYFSYEHFYVIYCKFWELDKDHDLLISKEDLGRHNDHAISSRMIDRIFSGAVTRGKHLQDGKMTYTEFVWFLMSEEDKKQPTSIEYWFRCMDLDGDGVLSMYELEYFYEEMVQKMEAMGIEPLPYNDCLCQMLDLVKPKVPNQITLHDLKACKQTNIFYDTFFNLDKYLDNEQRDPFANARDLDAEGAEPSDWEKYTAEEYEILVAEEGINETDEIAYEDDFEPEEDELQALELENMKLSDPPKKNLRPKSATGGISTSGSDADMYDFDSKDMGY